MIVIQSNHTTIILICLISFQLLVGCQQPDYPEFEEPVYTHTFRKAGTYEIEIDSVTASNFMHYQYYQDNGIEYFTFLNPIGQDIQFYDLNTKKLIYKIPLNFQGPESVGALQGLYSGYHIHSLDSIFVLNRNTGKFYIVNSLSTIISDFDFVDDKANPTSLLGPFARPLITNDKIYLMNNQSGIDYHSRNRKYGSDFASIIDLKNSKVEDFMSYPDSYTKGIWGDFLHRKSWAIDEKNSKILVSYPIDPQLYEYNLAGQLVNTHMGPNSYFEGPKSMNRKQRSNKVEQNKYFLAQDRYGFINFDPFNQIYIRDSQAGINPDNPKMSMKSIRRMILFDKSVNKIGEFELPTFERLRVFFNKEGMHRITESEVENTLKLEKYELVKIN